MSDLGQFPSQRKGVIWMLDMVMVVEGWNEIIRNLKISVAKTRNTERKKEAGKQWNFVNYRG